MDVKNHYIGVFALFDHKFLKGNMFCKKGSSSSATFPEGTGDGQYSTSYYGIIPMN